ncbi:KilA-N domain-containing protein [Niastella caeni]|uniref:KilA-N domain-containing protein n=1 Tax=Niastella caeni TaxID=2569763 RepID=UPI0021D010B8|nr:KilA-N domain-containing protein [Niastella caeni]
MPNSKVIVVKETSVRIIEVNEQDYISLTDMVRSMEDGTVLIEKWLRNKNTIEFIGIWEKINNPEFNSLEFEGIMLEAGINRFTLSAKKWGERTNAIGIIAKTGRFNSGAPMPTKTLPSSSAAGSAPSLNFISLKSSNV